MSSKHLTYSIGLCFALTLVGSSCDTGSFTVNMFSDSSTNSPLLVNDLQYPEWTTITQGVTLQQKLVKVNNVTELFTIVQIDPTMHTPAVAVDETSPKTVAEWQEFLSAMIVINGSYFDENYNLTTRTVAAAQPYGPLLTGKTGVVRTTDGQNWTITNTNAIPENKKPLFSIQSYPLLTENGRDVFTGGSTDNAQRTVVAQDAQGWLYFIIAEYGVLSLEELSTVLNTNFDIPFQAALNLDGGTSSGLLVQTGEQTMYHNSSVAVPSVLYIPAVD